MDSVYVYVRVVYVRVHVVIYMCKYSHLCLCLPDCPSVSQFLKWSHQQHTMQGLKALNNLIKENGSLFGNVSQRSHHRHQVDAAHAEENTFVDFLHQYQFCMAVDHLYSLILVNPNVNFSILIFPQKYGRHLLEYQCNCLETIQESLFSVVTSAA